MRREDRELIDFLVKELSKLPTLRSILLFGSLAKGEARPDSDIDLLLVFDEEDPYVRLDDVVRIICKSSLVRGVNPILTNMRDLDRDFLEEVLREGKLLWSRARP